MTARIMYLTYESIFLQDRVYTRVFFMYGACKFKKLSRFFSIDRIFFLFVGGEIDTYEYGPWLFLLMGGDR